MLKLALAIVVVRSSRTLWEDLPTVCRFLVRIVPNPYEALGGNWGYP
jgi:hypothetical protein